MVRTLAVTSLVDAVADDLKNQVLAGALQPGSPLTEIEVASRYDVARASAKAAIERLVAEKVLLRRNHKTARVAELGPEDVRDVYNTRIYLESEVLRRLARRRVVPTAAREANRDIQALWDAGSYDVVDPDMRFHTSLIDAVDSLRTSAAYRSLAFEVKLCMAQLQGSHALSPAVIIAEHSRLLDLIDAGEADAAAVLLDEHLSRARELLAASLGGEPGPEAFLPSTALDALAT